MSNYVGDSKGLHAFHHVDAISHGLLVRDDKVRHPLAVCSLIAARWLIQQGNHDGRSMRQTASMDTVPLLLCSHSTHSSPILRIQSQIPETSPIKGPVSPISAGSRAKAKCLQSMMESVNQRAVLEARIMIQLNDDAARVAYLDRIPGHEYRGKLLALLMTLPPEDLAQPYLDSLGGPLEVGSMSPAAHVVYNAFFFSGNSAPL